MLPIISVPQQIAQYLQDYRDVFCRDEGFDSISRYITGLLISPNTTLQAIHDLQVWENPEGLEWTLPSPVPYHTFTTPPLIK